MTAASVVAVACDSPPKTWMAPRYETAPAVPRGPIAGPFDQRSAAAS